jgi:hypothetical protein
MAALDVASTRCEFFSVGTDRQPFPTIVTVSNCNPGSAVYHDDLPVPSPLFSLFDLMAQRGSMKVGAGKFH